VAEATRLGKLRPIPWTRSPAGQRQQSGRGEPVIHFEQWEEDRVEVKLILKGGGCRTRNIQYRLPCTWTIWAARIGIWRESGNASFTRCGRRRARAAAGRRAMHRQDRAHGV